MLVVFVREFLASFVVVLTSLMDYRVPRSSLVEPVLSEINVLLYIVLLLVILVLKFRR